MGREITQVGAMCRPTQGSILSQILVGSPEEPDKECQLPDGLVFRLRRSFSNKANGKKNNESKKIRIKLPSHHCHESLVHKKGWLAIT